ncbi:MAG: MmcQ/YjbR family DNA-binding protein [Christensenellaceae bacterium]
MYVAITEEGRVYTKVVDPLSGDEYVLHHSAGAGGAFVGMVKADYETVLLEIAQKCFEPDVFKSDYAQKVISHVREVYGSEPEFLWEKFPGNAVFRRQDTHKWYGALLTVSKQKLGLDSNEAIEIIDLRARPDDIDSMVDHKKYFPGYHMNKKHWYTMCLDGTVPIEEICERIANSYELAIK